MSLETNKALVQQVMDAAFNQHDASVVDRFFTPTYIQHSSLVGTGPDAVRGLIGAFGPEVSYELVRIVAEGDLVVTHGRYTGFGPAPIAGCDLFRIENGRLAEHWDVLQEIPAELPHQNGML